MPSPSLTGQPAVYFLWLSSASASNAIAAIVVCAVSPVGISALAFAQLTYESLRDIEVCLRSVQPKLYHVGFRGKLAFHPG